MSTIAAAHLADAASVEVTDWQPKPTTLTPGQREATHELWSSPDGKVSTGVWACTPGLFTSVRDGFGETCCILSGQGTLHTDDGESVPLRPGTLIALPDGWRGRWEIAETIRKVYTIATT
jgi:uncharacterized cupin superfamily protein